MTKVEDISVKEQIIQESESEYWGESESEYWGLCCVIQIDCMFN